MAKKSIGQLHATVTANAAQFVDEFKRADNAALRHGRAIRKQVTDLVKDVEKDFSLKKLGKGFLSGLGIGGGIELARAGVEQLGSLLNAPTEHAKELSEYIEEIRADLAAIHDKRFAIHLDGLTDGKKPEAIAKELDKQRRALVSAESKLDQARNDVSRATASDFQAGSNEGQALKDRYHIGIFGGADAIASAAGLKIKEAQKQVDALKDKVAELSIKQTKATNDVSKAVEKALDDFFKPLDQSAEKIAKQREELVTSLRTPEEKRTAASRDAWDLFNRGVIDAQTRERIISKAEKGFQNDTRVDMGRWDKAAGVVKVDEMTRRGMGSGANYEEITKQNGKILAEIHEIMKRAAARGFMPTPHYSD